MNSIQSNGLCILSRIWNGAHIFTRCNKAHRINELAPMQEIQRETKRTVKSENESQ